MCNLTDVVFCLQGYLVTADDFGKVKLFNYPCVYNDAPYREYKGELISIVIRAIE